MNIAILYDYLYNKITKEIFTKEDITQYIYDIMTFLELNEYLTDVIFTDEINIDKDLDDIENALTCGVKIISTIHAYNINDLKNKQSFFRNIDKRLFDRFVVLSNDNGVGTLDGIYNENLKLLGVWWK